MGCDSSDVNPTGDPRGGILERGRHKFNRTKFISEMKKRGWGLDANGWIMPPSRTSVERDRDWEESILLAIECRLSSD
jgi:hypothetical protein